MNKRNRFITTLLLTISLILSTTMPIMAEEITDEIVEVQSVNEEASICSDEENLPSHSIILVNGYYVLNVPGTYASRAADAPYTDVVLTSFSNFAEDLLVTAEKEDAKKIYVTNTGSITASDNSPEHSVIVQGYDGHGEEFYINRNMFDVTDDELANLKLGEKHKGTYYDYYLPIPGLGIHAWSYHWESEGKEVLLNPSVEVVTNNYDYTGNNQEQTWIKITFTKGPDTPEQENIVIPEWEQNGYKRELLGDNGDYIEVLSQNEYNGKKQKPIVKVSYNGTEYSSGKGGTLKVKYSKNKDCGSVTATITKVKKNKSVTSALKGKTITFDIVPITVSDNNMKTTIKNGKVKSVKVMTGNKMKKVSKKMWKVNGNVLNFTGNYTGSVSLNSIN